VELQSGKLVCVGGKTEKDVYRSVNQIHNLLEEKDLMIYDRDYDFSQTSK